MAGMFASCNSMYRLRCNSIDPESRMKVTNQDRIREKHYNQNIFYTTFVSETVRV
jgi:hypothetical protein